MAAAGRDPLAALARVRRLETGFARRRLADAADRLSAAETREQAAAAALRAEQSAGAPADYAAWLGRGMAERQRAALGSAHAADQHGEMRAALTAARVAERGIERLIADRAAADRARRLRKAQTATDDAAGRNAAAAAAFTR